MFGHPKRWRLPFTRPSNESGRISKVNQRRPAGTHRHLASGGLYPRGPRLSNRVRPLRFNLTARRAIRVRGVQDDVPEVAPSAEVVGGGGASIQCAVSLELAAGRPRAMLRIATGGGGSHVAAARSDLSFDSSRGLGWGLVSLRCWTERQRQRPPMAFEEGDPA
ncbi:uncharacterized protein A4U43_UnF5670 [Asparagus officinalis]|uniref:Uncharacterized protein n=1 Tax=Asparagus officinalis TaxID=4686 RepID=A0A1R3L6M5_ASPOF|nr:uncharacterized protein A4U43_UnF5670 [Asparagus officinalis]